MFFAILLGLRYKKTRDPGSEWDLPEHIVNGQYQTFFVVGFEKCMIKWMSNRVGEGHLEVQNNSILAE